MNALEATFSRLITPAVDVSVAILPSQYRINRRTFAQTTATNTEYTCLQVEVALKNFGRKLQQSTYPLKALQARSGKRLVWLSSQGRFVAYSLSGRRVSVGGFHLLGRRCLDADRRLPLVLRYGIVLILRSVIHDDILTENSQHPCRRDSNRIEQPYDVNKRFSTTQQTNPYVLLWNQMNRDSEQGRTRMGYVEA